MRNELLKMIQLVMREKPYEPCSDVTEETLLDKPTDIIPLNTAEVLIALEWELERVIDESKIPSTKVKDILDYLESLREEGV